MERVVTSFIVFSILSVLLSGCSGGSSGGSEPIEPTAVHFEAPNTQNVFPLNDTGWTKCINGGAISNCDLSIHLPQDGMYGRDFQSQSATLNKVGGGYAGFDFLKLDEFGNILLNQNALSGWSCIYDNVTGLTWEVKVNDALHDSISTYSWFNSDDSRNGGDSGSQNAGACGIASCDTESFINAVNATNFCGYNDWQLPSRQELNSIINYGNGDYIISPLDPGFFPNGYYGSYWTATTDAEDPAQAWVFENSTSYPALKSIAANVRLVRSPY